MSAVASVYYAWKGLTQAQKKGTWQSDHPDQWEVCQQVMKLRSENGAD